MVIEESVFCPLGPGCWCHVVLVPSRSSHLTDPRPPHAPRCHAVSVASVAPSMSSAVVNAVVKRRTGGMGTPEMTPTLPPPAFATPAAMTPAWPRVRAQQQAGQLRRRERSEGDGERPS